MTPADPVAAAAKRITSLSLDPLAIELADRPCSLFIDPDSGSVFLDEGDGDDRVNGAVLKPANGPVFSARPAAGGGRVVAVAYCGIDLTLGETPDAARAEQWVERANGLMRRAGAETAPGARAGGETEVARRASPPWLWAYGDDFQLLKSGGQGDVWVGTMTTPGGGRKVVVKVPPHNAPNVESFIKEAMKWARVSEHPNIVTLVQVVISTDRVLLVSDYVPGGTLQDWGREAHTVNDIVRMMSGILTGIDHLHEKKLVHEDLKPQNILIDAGDPRITDFGVSKYLDGTGTRSTTVGGTFRYMAPEWVAAVAGRGTGAAAEPKPQQDIWSAGVILFELLYGEGECTRFVTAAPGAGGPAAVPLPAARTVPDRIQTVLRRALQPDPDLRYRTALEMLNDLQAYLLEAAETHPVAPDPARAERRKTEMIENLRRYAYQIHLHGITPDAAWDDLVVRAGEAFRICTDWRKRAALGGMHLDESDLRLDPDPAYWRNWGTEEEGFNDENWAIAEYIVRERDRHPAPDWRDHPLGRMDVSAVAAELGQSVGRWLRIEKTARPA